MHLLGPRSGAPCIPRRLEDVCCACGYTNNITLSSKIDQLNGTTLTNVVVNGVQGLAVSDIPDLSAHYLPISGGTITGGLTVTGSFSGGSLSLNTASSTNSFSTNATSTNLYAANLTLGSALSIANGGTGSTTLGGLLTGNGTGALTAAVLSAPLTFSGNTLAINQATLSQNGYLGSTDFTTFENKISSTSLSNGAGIGYNSSTGVISNTGVVSLAATYPLQTSGATGALTISTAFGTTTANTWSQLQQFQGAASTTLLSVYNGLFVGGTATTSIFGTATSTFGAGISATALNLSGSATSTAANGFNLSAGCFAVEGTCIGGSSSSLTIGATSISGGNNGDLLSILSGNLGDSGIPSIINSVPAVFISGTTIAQNYDSYGGGAGNTSSGSGGSVESTGFGYMALNAVDQGGANTAFGTAALQVVTSGTENTGLGTHAGKLITTGTFNTAVGTDVLFAATSSSNSTAIGAHALFFATAGPNTMVGSSGGASITTGTYNAGLGSNVLSSLTTGGSNVAVGDGALRSVQTNSNNTAVGYDAGLSSNGGGDNTLMGYLSGFGITTGAENTLLGSSGLIAGSYGQVTTGSQNIAIGYGVAVASPTTNGQLDIGNLIYGTGLTGTGSTVSNGLLGIGTKTPYSRLQVTGPDTASSTSAFSVVNNASTTEFQIFDGGNAQLAGTLTQNSDQRLKTNITSLDASSSLAAIDALNPVTFNWIDPTEGTAPQLGFIAQQVQQLFPALISTTSPTPLTPSGTLGLNYIGLISPMVSAIQALSSELTSLEATVAGFANSFTTKQLCVEKSDGTPVCISGDQLAGILSGTPSVQISVPTPPTISGTSTPPSINIQGSNPATINVGDTYTDLGAIVTDNQGHDLGYKTFLDGALVSNIVIDTTQVATDTIDYVATDTWGNTATSTRTVITKAASSSSN